MLVPYQRGQCLRHEGLTKSFLFFNHGCRPRARIPQFRVNVHVPPPRVLENVLVNFSSNPRVMHLRFQSLTFVSFSNADSTTKGTKMGSHMPVSTGLSKAELSEERRVLRCGRNSSFMKDSLRLGWPCWSSKGNHTSASCLPFCLLFLFP